MYISKCISPILITLLLSVVTSSVYAGAVHKWVDAQGVTHYSDQLPENISHPVKQIDVTNTYSNTANSNPDSSNYQQDYYSVTNQWARMREERLERKQLQLERAKQKAAQQPVIPQIVYINQAEEDQNRNAYYPAYFPTLGHRSIGLKQRKNYSNHYSSRFNGRYSGTRYNSASCKLPRNGNSRSSGSGGGSSRGASLTLSIR